MKAVFGVVDDIKKVASRGVTRIIVEIPVEHHVKATNLLFNRAVLITLTSMGGEYGVVGDEKEPEPDPKPESRLSDIKGDGKLAQALHVKGYFYNRTLWRHLHDSGLYTVQDHKAFVESLPCIAPKATEGICQGDVCAHHCDKAEIPAAGANLQPENPQKPPHWYTIPVCHGHHSNWVHGSHARSATRAEKEWMHTRAVEIMSRQVHVVMRTFLQLESLSDLTQAMLDRFEARIGLKEPAQC